MKAFNIISGVVLLGSLSCIPAQSGPLKYHHVQAKGDHSNITVEQHKQMVQKVGSAIAGTVADVVGEHTAKSERVLNKGVPRTFPLNNPVFQPNSHGVPGIAKVLSFQNGIICTGIHFKPWIVLTTAECVLNRKPEELFLEISMYIENNKEAVTVATEIKSITIHPRFRRGETEFNLALIYNFADFAWDVQEFVVTRLDLTPQDILFKRTETYIYHWIETGTQTHIPMKAYRPTTRNFFICGETEWFPNYFCAHTVKKETFTKIDLGIPLFVTVGTMKRCIGIYTGKHLGEDIQGHVFEGIHGSVDWIETFINEHPVPAFYQ